MAPRAHRRPRRHRSGDWYSVGVMLYQVLTGTLPFPGETLAAVIDKMRGAPPAPSCWRPTFRKTSARSAWTCWPGSPAAAHR